VEERALYIPDGDGYVGTILTQGGWHPDQANGGAVLALMGHCLEDVPSLVPMLVSRYTADLVRPVPLGKRVHVEHEIVREGKKIQVVRQHLLVDGVEHVRTTALRLRVEDMSGPDVPESTTDDDPGATLAPLEAGVSHRGNPQAPGFLGGIDLRRTPRLDGEGFGSWLRLDAAVVAGEPVRDTARLTVGFDFANLIGVDVKPDQLTLINPDVTAHVLRAPVDEWIAIVGETRFEPALGRGVSTGTLSDSAGLFAIVSISQLIQRR
jgi:hypothetical protein